MTLLELFALFLDEAAAEAWFANARWPDGLRCPRCGGDRVGPAKHRSMPFHCKDCRRYFSPKTGTAMEYSKLPYHTWGMLIYMMVTNRKGCSSCHVARCLGIRQLSAWFAGHRIREAFRSDTVPFSGPIEVDETYIGGKERNRHARKKKRLGRGAVGKLTVIGARDRDTNSLRATMVPNQSGKTLRAFVVSQKWPRAKVFTDGHGGYNGLPNHEIVDHKAGQYVNGDVHTNGIESFWAILKRGYHGTYHRMSNKHLRRYVNEFAARHNIRGLAVIEQMQYVVRNMEGWELDYVTLTA